MHPEHHKDRRRARAKALHKHYSGLQDIVHVDVAEYPSRDAFSIGIVNNQGQAHSAATICCMHAEEAEEAAIALAISGTTAEIIFSDSKTAVRNFASGKIHKPAMQILNKYPPPDRQIQIIWVPAHSSHPGNEAAHNYARGFVSRAVEGLDLGSARDRMVTFHEITMHYREGRQKYPPPHKSLNKLQQVTWRQLQTGSFANPYKYSLIYPGCFSPKCKNCDAYKADLTHIMSDCPGLKPRAELELNNTSDWEVAVSSSDPAVQLRTVNWALEVAESQGLTATSRRLAEETQ